MNIQLVILLLFWPVLALGATVNVYFLGGQSNDMSVVAEGIQSVIDSDGLNSILITSDYGLNTNRFWSRPSYELSSHIDSDFEHISSVFSGIEVAGYEPQLSGFFWFQGQSGKVDTVSTVESIAMEYEDTFGSNEPMPTIVIIDSSPGYNPPSDSSIVTDVDYVQIYMDPQPSHNPGSDPGNLTDEQAYSFGQTVGQTFIVIPEPRITLMIITVIIFCLRRNRCDTDFFAT